MNASNARPGTRVAPLSAWVTLLVAVMLCATAMADEDGQLSGMALVIGQSDYEHLDPLANPENDARKIEELLDGLGFETEIRLDRTVRRLRRDLDGFVEDAEGTDVALVYYSGHGIEAGGENYLLPIDTDVASLARADTDLVALSDLVQRLMSAAKIAIILVDARHGGFAGGVQVRQIELDGLERRTWYAQGGVRCRDPARHRLAWRGHRICGRARPDRPLTGHRRRQALMPPLFSNTSRYAATILPTS